MDEFKFADHPHLTTHKIFKARLAVAPSSHIPGLLLAPDKL